MMKILNITYLIMFISLLFFTFYMITMISESPVNYLIYMLLFCLFLFSYLCLIYPSNIYLFYFLIVTGGIMVTFLFFMVFNFKLTLNLKFMMYYMYLFILLLLFLFICLYGYNDNLIFKYSFELGDNLMMNCYIENHSVNLTFFSMTYLLIVMYLMVKISTYMKSSPMRNVKN